MDYALRDPAAIPSPQLLYYEDGIEANVAAALRQAGSPDRLWPHVKTHKTAEIITMLVRAGVRRFKCATLSECELAARCGAEAVLLAYPTVGPNQERFLRLSAAYPDIDWYAAADDVGQAEQFAARAQARGQALRLFADVNVGMDRTGVPLPGVPAFVSAVRERAPAAQICGLHCYDGQHGISDPDARRRAVAQTVRDVEAVRREVATLLGRPVDIIAGGSPEFPCYAELSDFYCSPGTVFVWDDGYAQLFPDLPYVPAAAVLTRVVSCPAPGLFTLDCGYKAVAADPRGERGRCVGPAAASTTVSQNEEHWVRRLTGGGVTPRPGDVIYVIPTHVCPTSALYPYALTVRDGAVTGRWQIAARDRRLNF